MDMSLLQVWSEPRWDKLEATSVLSWGLKKADGRLVSSQDRELIERVSELCKTSGTSDFESLKKFAREQLKVCKASRKDVAVSVPVAPEDSVDGTPDAKRLKLATPLTPEKAPESLILACRGCHKAFGEDCREGNLRGWCSPCIQENLLERGIDPQSGKFVSVHTRWDSSTTMQEFKGYAKDIAKHKASEILQAQKFSKELQAKPAEKIGKRPDEIKLCFICGKQKHECRWSLTGFGEPTGSTCYACVRTCAMLSDAGENKCTRSPEALQLAGIVEDIAIFSKRYASYVMNDDTCSCPKCRQQVYSDDTYWKAVQLLSPDSDISEWPESHDMWMETFSECLTHAGVDAVLKDLALRVKPDSSKIAKVSLIMDHLAKD